MTHDLFSTLDSSTLLVSFRTMAATPMKEVLLVGFGAVGAVCMYIGPTDESIGALNMNA